MEKFLNQSDCNIIEKDITLEALAWKLLMDDDVKEFAGSILPFVQNCELEGNNNTIQTNVSYNEFSDQFQILITIYLEMIFGLLKINHINNNLDKNGDLSEKIDIEKTFDPDMSNFKRDDLINTFRERLEKIRVFLNVNEIHDTDMTNPLDFGSNSEYFCKVLFRNTPEGKAFFRKNKKNLDPDKRYMFAVRYDSYKKQKQLSDFYAVCALPNMKVKISFSPINIIIRESHMMHQKL